MITPGGAGGPRPKRYKGMQVFVARGASKGLKFLQKQEAGIKASIVYPPGERPAPER